MKKTFAKNITEKRELLFARLSILVAVIIAGLFGIYPPAFVAQVVAFAFGLSAATLFPAICMGIFSMRINKQGAIAGMLIGLLFTISYIIYFKFLYPEMNSSEYWFLGISPEGIGFIGMLLNIFTSFLVSFFTPPPPNKIIKIIHEIREP